MRKKETMEGATGPTPDPGPSWPLTHKNKTASHDKGDGMLIFLNHLVNIFFVKRRAGASFSRQNRLNGRVLKEVVLKLGSQEVPGSMSRARGWHSFVVPACGLYRKESC